MPEGTNLSVVAANGPVTRRSIRASQRLLPLGAFAELIMQHLLCDLGGSLSLKNA